MESGGGTDAYEVVEHELCRIPDVNAARIVADATGRPVEVHILASPAKHAKQIVRDIQSVAMASFGLDLDRRIISVVQLETIPAEAERPSVVAEVSRAEEAEASRGGALNDVADVMEQSEGTKGTDVIELTPPVDSIDEEIDTAPRSPLAQHRVVVDGVTAVRNGMDCSVQVFLRRGDDQALGIAEGLVVSGSTQRLVASATLSALRQFEPSAARAEVETAVVMRLGERVVAVASVVFVVPPYEEVVAGSAIVRAAGEHDAMARAVLDATNRRLAQLTS